MKIGLHNILLLLGLAAVVGCRDMGHTPGENNGGQVLDLSVSIEEGASKAPITGAAFANGTHLFGLAVTKADGVTAYEAGSGNVWASAVVAGAGQTWTYKWGSMSAAGTILPLLYGGDPMQVAGYYPYNLSAGILAGRDAGRLNVPFDLTTTAEQSNQTDVLYSGVQSVGYATGARQSVALSFRHVYALLEFQVKLKREGVAASITKVEVCNKAGKAFLSNKGFFSPYTGALTASTAGNVSLTTATALNGSTYATIQVLVPPTLLAGYADGDIYVQLYDGGSADPKQFPILKAYLTQSGTYGLVGGGRYTYRLLYEHTAYGSITVEGWSSTVVADETLGSGPLPYVEIDGLRWAVGNLIADGANGCKIGAPGDGGLYFQFGSLIGWKGGASGNGTGVTNTSLSVDKAVWPLAMGTTKPSFAWQSKDAASITTLIDYYFNYSDGWATGGQDIRTFNNSIAGDSGTGTLATGRYAKQGVGDPCTYYLGGTWRTPITVEYATLVGYGAWVTSPAAGRWLGLSPGTVSSSVFFPASGLRSYSAGAFLYVGEFGSHWSSSVYGATYGAGLNFNRNNVALQSGHFRSRGLPVRCVQPAPTVPNPPAASDYVVINGLKWAKGNLVAVNGTNCKVGAVADYGVYFQFGSLVGWSGGANGNGVGTGSPATVVKVKPATYGGTDEWATVGRYKEGTMDNKEYNLPADAPTTGVGDPCRYYLGTPWRTPTAAEYLTLLGAAGANTNKVLPLKHSSYDLSFPASGNRSSSNGAFNSVGSIGFCWSSSVYGAMYGYVLAFSSGNVYPQNRYDRSIGFPVRCVAD